MGRATSAPLEARDVCGASYPHISTWITTVDQSNIALPQMDVMAFQAPGWSLQANVATNSSTTNGIAFSPDARRVYVGSDAAGHELAAINTTPFDSGFGKIAKTININSPKAPCKKMSASAVFIGPHADIAFVVDATGEPQAISAIDIREGSPTENQVLASVCNQSLGRAGAFTPDGLTLWVPGYHELTGVSQITLYNANVTSTSLLAHATIPLETGFFPAGIAINAAGTRAFVASEGLNLVRIFDVATRTKVADVTSGDGKFPDSIVIANNRAYMSTDDNVIRIYDANQGTYLGEWLGDRSEQSGHNLAASADGTRLFVTGNSPGYPVVVLDITNVQPVQVAALYEASTRAMVDPAVQPGPATVTNTIVSIVKALEAAHTLTDIPRATLLINEVQAALAQWQNGQRDYACINLNYFRSNVQYLVTAGQISASAGRQLLDSAQYLLSQYS